MFDRGRARLIAAALATLLVSSCFSVQTRRRTIDMGREATGGIALRVFADDTSRRAARPGPSGLFIELERKEGRGYAPVFRSLEPAWSVMGLPPGQYRLRFPSRLDDQGGTVPLDERPRTVRVRAGEVTEVDAVLEHVNKPLIVAGVVAAVVAVVLLDDWLDDLDLPAPPLPPPPHEVLDAVFWISLDLATAPPEPWSPVGPSRPPVVTSHFPAEGDLVTTRHLRVTFVLSEAIQAATVSEDCVEVNGERSGRLLGRARYDPERWWVVWETDDELPRDDSFRATLFADCAIDLRGVALDSDASFTFRTAP